jgi:hypothetical protein
MNVYFNQPLSIIFEMEKFVSAVEKVCILDTFMDHTNIW